MAVKGLTECLALPSRLLSIIHHPDVF